MKVLKVCFYSEDEYTRLLHVLAYQRIPHHVQIIQNNSVWLKTQRNMAWEYIIDIFLNNEASRLFLTHPDSRFLLDSNRIDMYILSQMTYGKPVPNTADLITSCYLWNYRHTPQTRQEAMLAHFDLEKMQKQYDYVCFQMVECRLKNQSEQYDFFFEAHVSDPNGIDEIYSKTFVSSMRQHSESFLDVTTRRLSFGRVSVNEFSHICEREEK